MTTPNSAAGKQGVGWLPPLSMLGAADMDYVAARSLMLSAIFPAGQAKAAEAVEKLLKLSVMCEHGIDTGQLATPREVRGFDHGIVKLFERMVARIRTTGVAGASDLLTKPEDDWVWAFVEHLEQAYKRRYPDRWAMAMQYSSDDLIKLDVIYPWIRNVVVPNMPDEHQEKARIFGTSFASAYTPQVLDVIRSRGVLTPFDILRLHNAKLEELEIRHDLLP